MGRRLATRRRPETVSPTRANGDERSWPVGSAALQVARGVVTAT